ncbi:Fe(3+)-hydroxamate ABC transporter substrate-binding protein FhuD [Dickeya fangzhongdai]|uniref:Fe(3+)-hydroxamate ABC transporter substrate-binding protein FhuD n=1 Tax=Dickeya fangzhongdai TaxID=1778540 RepID=UPI0004F6AC2E|nr:Fe(3+)-hydroxamate ABC transporter substrate-binding protein FhuD [Dickeya fangzhongdai]AIR71039.1 iron-hydroxamate transporter substrate-binding subunit [Dickeya fangzhongdai]KGT97938.1 iron-hydroxamate transporter substrate-binding subunit [Dickeya fangzhongdai]WPD75143.1 Fe(3+)-hydroxamate ABC transporter substrate-binding protein FhuD [Dickeya fangzhongdai]
MLNKMMGSPNKPDALRRRLLAAMLVAPWFSPFDTRAAAVDSQRIVALEWLPVELLMALGVMPMGVADIHNYRLWVQAPALPASVVDVGLRTEPNLELLARLNPSLLLYSTGYGPAAEQLERIAPSLGFAFSDGNGKPLQVARQSLTTLAERLEMNAAAERHLTAFDQFMAEARVRLQPYTRRPLLLFSVLDERHVLVVGKNSLFQDVLDQLGIENAWQGSTNFWGSTVIGMEQLASVGHANAICFEHGNEGLMSRVSANPVWRSLPFVRDQRWQRAEAVWLYGATLSAMRFCRLLDGAMERLT